jgi:hypothetical protein
MVEPSIYDKLAARQVSETTVSEFNTITKDTFIDKKNVEFWSGVITVARAMEESRTYSHGLPIPESGAMSTVSVDDGASEAIKPTGTEIWQVQGLNTDNCSPFLTDGSAIFPIVLGGDGATLTGPLYLTATMWIGFSNASGSAQTPGVAYFKVGL